MAEMFQKLRAYVGAALVRSGLWVLGAGLPDPQPYAVDNADDDDEGEDLPLGAAMVSPVEITREAAAMIFEPAPVAAPAVAEPLAGSWEARVQRARREMGDR